MPTTTPEPIIATLQSQRDFWDIIALVATISTGIVIALAAAFALLVQRARYLREIEPILAVESPYGHTTSGAGNSRVLAIGARLINQGNHHVFGLQEYDIEVQLLGDSNVVLGDYAFGESESVDLLPGANHRFEFLSPTKGESNLKQVNFEMKFRYHPNQELLLFLFSP